MFKKRGVVSLLFGLGVLCGTAGSVPALAGPKEDARAAVEKWAEAFNAGSVERVTALFRSDALFWGTSSQSLITTPDQVKGYFENVFKRPISVKFKSGEAQALSESVVAEAGEFEFTIPPGASGGSPMVVPARYHVILVKDGGDWKIAALHSSRKPQ